MITVHHTRQIFFPVTRLFTSQLSTTAQTCGRGISKVGNAETEKEKVLVRDWGQ
jgi:hypothetical protein